LSVSDRSYLKYSISYVHNFGTRRRRSSFCIKSYLLFSSDVATKQAFAATSVSLPSYVMNSTQCHPLIL
jgi:hypothetical protein